MERFRVSTSGHSSTELTIFKDGCFCRSLLFGSELAQAGFSWDHSSYMVPDAIFLDSAKTMIMERAGKELRQYTSENKILEYVIEYPWQNVVVKAVCECGSEKVGSERHSSWCPKHNRSSL